MVIWLVVVLCRWTVCMAITYSYEIYDGKALDGDNHYTHITKLTQQGCKDLCTNPPAGLDCQSLEYKPADGTCVLSMTRVSDPGVLIDAVGYVFMRKIEGKAETTTESSPTTTISITTAAPTTTTAFPTTTSTAAPTTSTAVPTTTTMPPTTTTIPPTTTAVPPTTSVLPTTTVPPTSITTVSTTAKFLPTTTSATTTTTTATTTTPPTTTSSTISITSLQQTSTTAAVVTTTETDETTSPTIVAKTAANTTPIATVTTSTMGEQSSTIENTESHTFSSIISKLQTVQETSNPPETTLSNTNNNNSNTEYENINNVTIEMNATSEHVPVTTQTPLKPQEVVDPDQRPSAKVIGGIGVFLMIGMLCTIFIMDIDTYARNLKYLRRNIRDIPFPQLCRTSRKLKISHYCEGSFNS